MFDNMIILKNRKKFTLTMSLKILMLIELQVFKKKKKLNK
jgi:hypothetical protein